MKKKTGLLICVSALVLSLGVTLGIEAANNSTKQAEAIEAAGKVTLSTSITPSYSKIYRFTKPIDDYWGTTVYVHAWGSSTAANNTTWPGIDISECFSYNESDRKVYTFCTEVTDYQYLQFHNNSGYKTDDITIGSNTAWYLDSGNTPGTWTPEEQIYYFYDSKDIFEGNLKCYAWQSNGKLKNTDYPGETMAKVQYGSGQLYSIILDPAFDEFKCGIGDSKNTGDQWINKNRGRVFWWKDTGVYEWSQDLPWIKAHDWANNTMHIRDIPTSDVSDTGACRGANGYYQKARTAYTSFDETILAKFQFVDEYEDAQTRFVEWARVNGETASFSGTTLTVNSIKYGGLTTITASADDNTAVVVIVTFVAVGAIASYFFIGKKKKQ